MKFRPQIQLRFRDEADYARVKSLAAAEAISVNEWVLRKTEADNDRYNTARKDRTSAVETEDRGGRNRRVTGKESIPHSRSKAVEDKVAAVTEGVRACPDCGNEMIWNDKTKRWNCECGFQMKG